MNGHMISERFKPQQSLINRASSVFIVLMLHFSTAQRCFKSSREIHKVVVVKLPNVFNVGAMDHFSFMSTARQRRYCLTYSLPFSYVFKKYAGSRQGIFDFSIWPIHTFWVPNNCFTYQTLCKQS